MVPKAESVTLESGMPKLVWLRKLKNSERNCDGELAPHAGEGRRRQADNAANDLQRAGEHGRVGGAKHLQQQIEKNDGNSARDQSRHGCNIGRLTSKSRITSKKRDHFIWPSNLAAPLSRADNCFNASRPPAA